MNIQWKMEFLPILEVIAKNRAFGNNIIFLQQFFQVWGGGVSYVPPGGNYVSIKQSFGYPENFRNF